MCLQARASPKATDADEKAPRPVRTDESGGVECGNQTTDATLARRRAGGSRSKEYSMRLPPAASLTTEIQLGAEYPACCYSFSRPYDHECTVRDPFGYCAGYAAQ